jgi:hypothetical protein
MRHLQSQRSLPAIGGKNRPVLSPLARKLRLEPAHRVAVLNAPPGYVDRLKPAPEELRTELLPHDLFDAVQVFVSGIEELRSLGQAAIRAVKPGGLLWIACPRGGTDLPATPEWMSRDVLGEITSETGYKPVALVKIDESWTALRFTRIE